MHKRTTSPLLPNISIVVIGLNVENYLARALNAVRNSDYPREKLEIIYVDSGSTDMSRPIAAGFPEVQLIDLNDPAPNAAKGRNAGFRAAKHEVIQFVDADSYLDPAWMKQAVSVLKGDVGAVAGHLNERYPEKNFFHKMAHLEWNLRVGSDGWSTQSTEALTFGGNVMLHKRVFLAAGGYDETMIAGEDPDLSYRVRHTGFRILRLNSPMASHDNNLKSWRQYLTRTYRSGIAYALLAKKYWTQSEKFMMKRLMRIFGGVLLPQMMIFSGILFNQVALGVALGLLVAFRLVFKTSKFARLFGISRTRAFQYALYLALSIYPQFMGVLSTFGKALIAQGRHGLSHFRNISFSTTVTPLYEERQN